MNILIIVSSLNFGGAEKQAIEDANLLSIEHNVYLIAFSNGPLANTIKSKVKLLHISKLGYFRTSIKLYKIIKRNSIEIIHSHLYAPMVISAIAGTLAKIPVVWNFHSHAYENYVLGKLLQKYTARLPFVKKILFPSHELQQYYFVQSYGLRKNKCEIAYNSGQDFPEKKPSAILEEKKIIRIGFIGRAVKLKRIQYLIELASFLHQQNQYCFKIDIVGDGPELSYLIKETKNKILTEHIEYHGFQEDTAFFYRNLDIFALPSEEEVLSLSLIDAGLAGVPTVAFNIGGNEDIITNFETGYLVDTKIEFFTKILELLKSKHLRNEFGVNARKKCITKFSSQSRLNYLSRLYEKLI